MTGQVHGRKGNDMYEMKYLTEDDMPYFRRLAKEGRAVIEALNYILEEVHIGSVLLLNKKGFTFGETPYTKRFYSIRIYYPY